MIGSFENAVSAWTDLGDVSPKQLVDARLQAHWAAQVVAAFGSTHVEKRDDDSHSNLGLTAGGLLASHAAGGVRAAIRVRDLTLVLVTAEPSVEELPLSGKTLDAAMSWLGERAGAHLKSPKPLARPTHDLPAHAVGDGAEFDADPKALLELAAWYGNADRLIGAVREEHEHASEVRCWPHHFDIATLVSIDPSETGENARSIGVGMTPGDGGYSEPYFYVTPWPYPKAASPPDLDGGGAWHTEGWFGAVLTASRLLEAEDPATRAVAFLRSALRESLRLVAL